MTQSNEKPRQTKTIIIDGGMGRELAAMGAPFKQPEWSALALMEAPETVRAAHDNFIQAGAEVIITNSYAVVPFHIGQERFDERGRELIRLSAEIAYNAANSANHKVLVAGSIPPLFGSYAPDAFDINNAEDIALPLIEEQDPFVDLWIIETISSIEEGTFIAKLLEKTNKPIWAAYTLTDREDENEPATIRSGESVKDAISAAQQWKHVEAILFNCSRPEEMADAIKIAKEHCKPNIQIGAYANSFGRKIKAGHLANNDLSTLREELTPDAYSDFASAWRGLGASIIGGCCGIGPDHIRKLKEVLS